MRRRPPRMRARGRQSSMTARPMKSPAMKSSGSGFNLIQPSKIACSGPNEQRCKQRSRSWVCCSTYDASSFFGDVRFPNGKLEKRHRSVKNEPSRPLHLVGGLPWYHSPSTARQTSYFAPCAAYSSEHGKTIDPAPAPNKTHFLTASSRSRLPFLQLRPFSPATHRKSLQVS